MLGVISEINQDQDQQLNKSNTLVKKIGVRNGRFTLLKQKT